MALFSRRDKSDRPTPEPAAPAADETGGVDATDAEASAAAAADSASAGPVSADAPDAGAPAAAPVPHVSISVNTFGHGAETARPLDSALAAASGDSAAPAAPASTRPAATAPAATEAIPGLADNVLLQAALAALPDEPQSADIMNVMRQALQGQLYLRAQGDAQALIAAGQGLNLAVTTYQDKRFLLVFSGGDPMRQSVAAEAAAAVVDSATSVVGQAAHNVFRTAVDSGYDGVYLDHANVGARLVLPIELVQNRRLIAAR